MAAPSLWNYLWQAGFSVKLVILVLVLTSLLSWALIIQRSRQLKAVQQDVDAFEDAFWAGQDMASLYQNVHSKPQLNVIEQIFVAGYKELEPVISGAQTQVSEPRLVARVQRALQIKQARSMGPWMHQLSWLATIGSTAPYVGLFGTVCGIINAFQSLGTAQQATLALVAPGISEALVTTALGLFVAIPAVIAYNRLSSQLNHLFEQLDRFEAEFCQIISHQLQEGN